ncbi:MerR family transcriptional regulator [Virgibacillus proomii]|uniref:MerR family transcriptional regulator n=1 Tax=Virgibacillus proomii TaxID=84407 RepID=UPI00098559C3|nr:MerR family transcriptional regulator [Virgibacillus proomii]
MSDNYFTVKRFAKMIGTTERTLQYYDRKGVLKPTSYTEHGHRLYSHADIFKMQKILTLKYLGFSLKEIKEHLSENAANTIHETLQQQKKLLIEKWKQLDQVIHTISRVEKIIQHKEMNSDLLLSIIHAIQTESNQEEWLGKHLSKSVIEKVFMRHHSEEERITIEREVMAYLHQIQQFYNQGFPPQHAEVQRIIQQLIEFGNDLLEPELLKELEKLELKELGDDALYYFTIMSQELEEYINEAVDICKEKNSTV